jgi:5-hydroxyisourate hydrolase-like protein (transthyretin family)
VLDRDNHPVPGAEVTATGWEVPPQFALTDSLGKFTFAHPGLRPGTVIRASHNELSAQAATLYAGESDLVIPVAPDSQCTVTGDVKDAKGLPIVNAIVSLISWDGFERNSIADTTTDKNGRYQFPPSYRDITYSVEMFKVGFLSASSPNFKVELEQNKLQVPTIVPDFSDSFAGGTVLTAEGKPAKSVTIFDHDTFYSQTTTDDTGHFLLTNVPRDKTEVYLKGLDQSFTSQTLLTGRQDNMVYLQPPPAPQKFPTLIAERACVALMQKGDIMVDVQKPLT